MRGASEERGDRGAADAVQVRQVLDVQVGQQVAGDQQDARGGDAVVDESDRVGGPEVVASGLGGRADHVQAEVEAVALGEGEHLGPTGLQRHHNHL